jgi:hypothetical protein
LFVRVAEHGDQLIAIRQLLLADNVCRDGAVQLLTAGQVGLDGVVLLSSDFLGAGVELVLLVDRSTERGRQIGAAASPGVYARGGREQQNRCAAGKNRNADERHGRAPCILCFQNHFRVRE